MARKDSKSKKLMHEQLITLSRIAITLDEVQDIIGTLPTIVGVTSDIEEALRNVGDAQSNLRKAIYDDYN